VISVTEWTRRGNPALIADFGSPEEARASIEALEHHGIDGLEISIVAEADEIRRQSADRRTLVHLTGRVAKGIGAGALVGAVLFCVAGVAFVAAGWPLGAAVALVLAGATIGATAGAFIGVERGVAASEGWERTFHEPKATPVSIGVHTADASDVVRAREVLEGHHPLALRDLAAARTRR